MNLFLDITSRYIHLMCVSTSRNSTSGQEAIATPILGLAPKWDETLFDGFKASVYKCKKERSVAFKISHVFPDGGAHDASQTLYSAGKGTLPPLAVATWRLDFGGKHCPPNIFSRTAPTRYTEGLYTVVLWKVE